MRQAGQVRQVGQVGMMSSQRSVPIGSESVPFELFEEDVEVQTLLGVDEGNLRTDTTAGETSIHPSADGSIRTRAVRPTSLGWALVLVLVLVSVGGRLNSCSMLQ